MCGASQKKRASNRRRPALSAPQANPLRSHVSALLLLGVVFALAGCKVGPNFTTPSADLNKDWNTELSPQIATQTATDQQWWKTFHDEALDRLVELAYRQNLSLQMAGLRIVEGRARLGITRSQLYSPQATDVFGNVNAVGVPARLSNGLGFNRNFANYLMGFDASWEADLWGKYRRGVESNTASLLSTVADYYAIIVSLTAEVARTYSMVRTYEVLIELAEANAKLQEHSLQIAESRFRNGATSELDVAQATTLFESTRASIPQLRSDLQQARNALSTLLGQPTGAVESLLAGPKEIPKAPSHVAVGVPAEMLRRRPDIRRAELDAAAQCARIGIAKAELYPSFSLFGAFGLWGNNTGQGTHNLFSADSIFYAFGPRVNWPILNYGRLTNNVRVEDARFEQSLVNYHDTVLKAAQEVEDALSGFLTAQEAMAFQERSVAAAQRSEQLAVVQYREGAVDFQRVVDAQRFLLQQENDLARIRSAVSTNLIALYKALGGGWEARRDQPVISERTRKEMQNRTRWGDMLTEPQAQETKAVSPAAKQ